MKILIVSDKKLRIEGNWQEVPIETFQKWIDSIKIHTSAHTWWENIRSKVKQIFVRKRREKGQFGQPIPVWLFATDTQVWRLFMLTPQLLYDLKKPLVPW